MSQTRKSPIERMPALWPGVALVFVSGLAIIALVVSGARRISSVGVDIAMVTFVVAPLVHWLYCVYRLHDALRAVEGYKHPITPRRAVALHFIPIYNLYWVFYWVTKIAEFVNGRVQREEMQGRRVGLGLAAAFVPTQFLLWFGFLISYAICAHIARKMHLAFRTSLLPPPATEIDLSPA